VETPVELRCYFYYYIAVTDSVHYNCGLSTSAVTPLVECTNAVDGVFADVDMYGCGQALQKF
jgi:hypothetical protein